MINIQVSERFKKSYRKLPEKIKQRAKERETVFRAGPFDPSIKTHKLSGKEAGIWAFWINDSYRIKFIFLPNKEVLFLDIGTHKIYK
ncbi:type II toxin-antitoxin system mRNA interferase toxin, RelE/StbE family [Patescibacteria group bacterium]|nr:type II toxin-antitoxin system mRNA interferase toxin, RelE/StbE family [Patescibacteria group bacterium]